MTITQILTLIVGSTLLYASPLIFTALGGTFSERSGVVNVGLEGIMVVGSFASIVFNLECAESFGAATPWIGLLVGGIAGLLFAIIHAIATVNLRADHVISGTVLNLIAPALCVVLTRLLYEDKGQTDIITESFGLFSFPILEDIPVIGPIFFKNTYVVAYIAILVACVSWFILFKTRFGLRLRAVGEYPQAADTLGIHVSSMKYYAVLLSGFLGGIGGAVVSQSITRNFSAATIAGQGFMAMAAMIFGKWNPIGAMFSSLFFGLAQSLSIVGTAIPVISDIPSIYLKITPYIVTIIVLVLFIGKSEAPAAIGKNYIKSK
ncbi:ABC transporter permease [Granulicatella sp. zg-ZJ]|uniref:ABC transporter permease n=1 Tax=unclassified Granulicatella TaxID=2630493 RepID=UPI0013BF70E9|nr:MULTISPECIES: ABC transporter permease [unclassified Granulicatella]MBS4749553.1 ABC transporter permease [Carnobacteriaceae bacterium zg-ZUI78]NEW62686.1 ABC transporter permease [Granulicatella sp. zg-ZJ]NEW65745.1 ABC transporter permease [Granulicatella sp. zg-84]QMI86502.1 ABC transporter permease [Carnobacteriaceae bacterium zg-84]